MILRLWNYTREDILEICKSHPFPGTEKWPAEHPIWDSFLPGCLSPREAWSDDELLKKAIDNMFWIIEKSFREEKYEDFIRYHKQAFFEAQGENGNVVPLLRKVLTRFTVAKIAPKVTALSKTQWLKIIEDAGFSPDVFKNGVYLPMAGFGGILEGYKLYCKKYNIPYDASKIECYDINPKFCKWYGWGERDMLGEKRETDKIVLSCPPFGKFYEHWKGTPDDMSDITFIEWFALIKEYVKAPHYIIMGPELNFTIQKIDSNGKPFNGLFRKKIGVQLWTDEIYEKVKNMPKEEKLKLGLKE